MSIKLSDIITNVETSEQEIYKYIYDKLNETELNDRIYLLFGDSISETTYKDTPFIWVEGMENVYENSFTKKPFGKELAFCTKTIFISYFDKDINNIFVKSEQILKNFKECGFRSALDRKVFYKFEFVKSNILSFTSKLRDLKCNVLEISYMYPILYNDQFEEVGDYRFEVDTRPELDKIIVKGD